MDQPKITPTTGDLMKNGGLSGYGPISVSSTFEFRGVAAPGFGLQGLQHKLGQQGQLNQTPLNIPPLQSEVPVEKKPLKVALIGTAPSSRMLAPFNDPEWTIWVCSPGNMNVIPKIDAWFEIHGNLLWPENKHYGEAYIEWLKKQTFPIYMQDQGYVPNALSFPKDELVKEFGPDFFTSSFAWMMAFAMTQGAVEIALYGIDMASKDEYILQRPGFYFFRHMAERRGVKVSAPKESDIMQPPGLYGYSEVTPFGRKILARNIEIKQRRDAMVAERDRLQHSIVYLDGALEDLDYVNSIWGGAQSHQTQGG